MRLSEKDMTRLVKKIIKENTSVKMSGDGSIEMGDKMVLIKGVSAKRVKGALMLLSNEIRFIAIHDCEYADFTDIDICGFPELAMVNLQGTPNNLEDVVECDYNKLDGQRYNFMV